MLKKLYRKHKDLIPYAFFGVCTTLVNTGVYWLCAYPLGLPVIPSTVIAWVLAVLFAYLTNRRWVFHSEAATRKAVLREALAFYACRLTTGIIDWVGMYVFVDLLHYHDLAMKIVVNIVVILLNYAASKRLIFRRANTLDKR